jgi:hypothetical protein
MAVLGVVFLVLIALAVLFGLIVLVMALPDISRYRRLRRM